MLYTIRATLTTHGTPEALASSRTMAGWATVHADANNAGPIYVGGLDETKAIAVKNSADNALAYVGHRLIPGDFCNLREMGGPTYLDLSKIYWDADNTGDSIIVNYGRR